MDEVHCSITFECHDVTVDTRLQGISGVGTQVMSAARPKNLGGPIALASAALLGIILATVPVMGTTPALAAPPSSVSIPVSVVGGQSEPGGAHPTVQIMVGGWGPIPVLVDTGSSGLHVFAGAVNAGSGVTVTDQTSNITYAGGYRFKGVVASAAVQLGGARTTGPVSFALVQSASCVASQADCAAAAGIQGFEADRGVDGILGIGMQSSEGGVTSPILGIAGSLGKRWSLHLDGSSGQLVLGARVIGSGDPVARIQLQPDGTSDGHSLWADSQIPLCVTAGPIQACVPALFDSGTASTQISGPILSQAATVPGTSQVVSGTPMAVSLSGEPLFWTFTAGSEKSADLVRVMSDQGPFFNSGVQAFYDFTITYNAKKGVVTLTS
jgi:hypothetical protein